MVHCLIILFSSPVQHREAEYAVRKAKMLRGAGHTVSMFLLGDGVYSASKPPSLKGGADVVADMAGLGDVGIVACSTCSAIRGVVTVISNAKIGGLEDIVQEIEAADMIFNYTAEE